MTLLLVLLLAILWGAVFIPALVRDRRESSPWASVGTYRRGMRALSSGPSHSSGRWVLMPKTPDEIEVPRKRSKRRRRRIFTALVLSAAATLVLGIFPDLREILRVHLALDLIVVGYILYLIQAKHREAEDYRPRRLYGEEEPEEEPRLARAEHF